MNVPLVTRASVVFVACLLMLDVAHGREMYLKAQKYEQEPHSEQAVSVLNGTFEKSTDAIEYSRLQDLRVQKGDAVVHPSGDNWTTDQSFAYFRYKVGGPGTYVVGVRTKARDVEFTREQFAAYLSMLGQDDLLQGLESQSGKDKILERYSKSATALIQVGDDRTPVKESELGYPVEIVLDQHPDDIRFGSLVGVQILMNGAPLVNQPIRASCDGFHGHTAGGGHISHYDLVTDDAGKSSMLISQKCIWYVSLTAVRKSESSDVDYESYWATTTFEVN